MRVHARLGFIETTNLPSFITLIRCFIGRSKPLGRHEEFGQAVFHKKVKIQRSPGTPSDYRTPRQVYEAQYRWICGRSASPTGCAFDHIPTGTTISKGFNNDGSKGIVTVAVPP